MAHTQRAVGRGDRKTLTECVTVVCSCGACLHRTYGDQSVSHASLLLNAKAPPPPPPPPPPPRDTNISACTRWCSALPSPLCSAATHPLSPLTLRLPLISSRSVGMDCTSYTYDRQPPQVIVCNPYINQALLLDCAITGTGPIQLQWYFAPLHNPLSAILITNGSRYQLDDYSYQNTTRVGLTVRGLSPASENMTSGYYWCQGSVPRGELTPSLKAKLEISEYYRYIENPCFKKTYIRNSEIGCPAVMNATAPEPPQVATAISMATNNTVWPPNPTPMQLPPFWQATQRVNNDSEGSVFLLRSTVSASSGTDLVGRGVPPLSSSNTWLYVILGISAVSLLIIVVLGVVIFFMCRRHAQKENLECKLAPPLPFWGCVVWHEGR